MTKIIVECDKCKHQYKIHNKRVGEKFHCFCGSLLTIPSVKIHDAAVVRCSSCGGTRGKDNEPYCRYCGSSFTLHERDLNTICPYCMTRISSKARFCHSCSTPIVADSEDFVKTTMPCPSCDDSKLHSRKMMRQSFSLKECNHCAGLWISAGVFRHLEQKAQLVAASGVLAGIVENNINKVRQETNSPEKYYRKCPQCNVLMHRRNYANSSGIVVDVCSKHGMWFDIHELEEILNFIRSGELLKNQKKSARRAKLAMRRAKTAPVKKSLAGHNIYTSSSNVDIFSDIIDWLID
ncbi:MAG: zf-TFIIB domain-containing protein [Alcanivoracaceae bacterium]|nr:zf-TFIIB domain-containing protein [Alcanivoracaceae bacterium]